MCEGVRQPGTGIPGQCELWVLGFEPESSGRADSACSQLLSHLQPWFRYLTASVVVALLCHR